MDKSQSAPSGSSPIADIIDPQSDKVIDVMSAPSPSTEVLPPDAIVDSQTTDMGDNPPVDYDASGEPPPLSDPNSVEQEENLEVNADNQIEMIQVIEHYEQSQQTPILYSLPTEGAYVTVCDVDGTVSVDGAGGADGGMVPAGDAQQDGQDSAGILLNAIMAADLTPQNASTIQ